MIFDPNFVQIGFIVKAHGTGGWLKINNLENSISDLSEMEFLFLSIHNQKVPFQIESIKESADLIKLKGIESIEDAHAILKSGIFRIQTANEPKEDKGLVGYLIVNKELKKIGRIDGIEEIPGNPLIRVKDDNDFIYLPFNESFIVACDKLNQVLTYNIPEGLLDL